MKRPDHTNNNIWNHLFGNLYYMKPNNETCPSNTPFVDPIKDLRYTRIIGRFYHRKWLGRRFD